MAHLQCDKEITALLVIDPYNDFISAGGKVWDSLRGVAEANQCVPLMRQVLNAARKAELRVFYALHRRYRPGDYETWKSIAPVQKAGWLRKSFEDGTWDGEIRQLIVMELIAHTCVEATGRYAAALGSEVTMVKDATADDSEEEIHAALDINIPNYASAIGITHQVVARSLLSTPEASVRSSLT